MCFFVGYTQFPNGTTLNSRMELHSIPEGATLNSRRNYTQFPKELHSIPEGNLTFCFFLPQKSILFAHFLQKKLHNAAYRLTQSY